MDLIDQITERYEELSDTEHDALVAKFLSARAGDQLRQQLLQGWADRDETHVRRILSFLFDLTANEYVDQARTTLAAVMDVVVALYWNRPFEDEDITNLVWSITCEHFGVGYTEEPRFESEHPESETDSKRILALIDRMRTLR